ncbi:response regulator [Motilibacter aurantiacus]|uniref:response regulator n=1 Tax=Motilibacter aurantiacus TaxID=2714955 RepID=UPI00140DD09D|nr:response regulator [Motilibacter aurantiacus]NHC46768.1 response regulator [Motilibacter aurantiacus]
MKTVMLVDDSPTMLMSIKSVLTKAGLSVETAKDGQDALDQIKKGLKPNLVISDVNMPRLDGISFVREARKAGLRFVPILMLTTESEQSKREEAKKAGATGWLVKPVQPDALLGVVRQVLPGA